MLVSLQFSAIVITFAYFLARAKEESLDKMSRFLIVAAAVLTVASCSVVNKQVPVVRQLPGASQIPSPPNIPGGSQIPSGGPPAFQCQANQTCDVCKQDCINASNNQYVQPVSSAATQQNIDFCNQVYNQCVAAQQPGTGGGNPPATPQLPPLPGGSDSG